ncbi:hypothetical protein XENOCAPTIV_016888 [Xenoophorus captivus]|uniref:Uncharacterized protein n=1 Tax=Xenoophorus captivus TaxID=1517983 RepID=A0ABV0QAF0_9TELE
MGQCDQATVHWGINVHTLRPKLFILSAALSSAALETADQELCPHPHGFTFSSHPQPLTSFWSSLAHYLFPDSFIYTPLSQDSSLFMRLSSTPIIQYISSPH